MASIRLASHYLDDFLILVPPLTDSSADVRSSALAVFSHLGVPISEHKTEGPASIHYVPCY